MFSYIRTLAVAAAAALAFTATQSQAATVTPVVDGGVYDIGYGDNFGGLVIGNGDAGSWTVRFDAVSDPVFSHALLTVSNLIAGTFENLTVSWIAVSDGYNLLSTAVLGGDYVLPTVFTANGVHGGDDTSQLLTFTWTNSVAGLGFDVAVLAAVPLPAGGLLLIGALGGLAMLRRRNGAAAA